MGGLFNIRLPERKSTIGTSFEPLIAISFRDSLFLSILRESSATIIGINEGLCSCINKGSMYPGCENINRHRTHLFHPRLLRAVITAATGFWRKSGSRIPKLMFSKKKQQITRDGIIFKNTIGNDVNIFRPVTATPCCYATREPQTFAKKTFGRENVSRPIYSCSQSFVHSAYSISFHIP